MHYFLVLFCFLDMLYICWPMLCSGHLLTSVVFKISAAGHCHVFRTYADICNFVDASWPLLVPRHLYVIWKPVDLSCVLEIWCLRFVLEICWPLLCSGNLWLLLCFGNLLTTIVFWKSVDCCYVLEICWPLLCSGNLWLLLCFGNLWLPWFFVNLLATVVLWKNGDLCYVLEICWQLLCSGNLLTTVMFRHQLATVVF